jgi:hypothetical protein
MDAAFYQREAARCRRMAEEQPDGSAAKHMLELAQEYEALAQDLETEGPPKRPRD